MACLAYLSHRIGHSSLAHNPAVPSPLFVSRFGQGRPLMCIHGIESHGLRFIGLASRLPDAQIAAPDLRGHGRSPMEGEWTLEEQMADLLPLLHELGPETVLLGHSYGGFLAWQMAARAPDRLTGLVLVDPAINVNAELARVSTEEYTSLSLSWADAAEAFAAMSVGRTKEALWSVAMDAGLATGLGPDGRLHPLLAREAVTAAWAQMQDPLSVSAWRGPTLLLEAGRENGAYVSADVVGGMRAQLGDNLRHVILDSTHSIPSDYPDLLAQQVEAFVSR